MNIVIYKEVSKQNLYAAVSDVTKLPIGNWEEVTRFESAGRSRIAFDEAEAEAVIAEKGFFLFGVELRFTASGTGRSSL